MRERKTFGVRSAVALDRVVLLWEKLQTSTRNPRGPPALHTKNRKLHFLSEWKKCQDDECRVITSHYSLLNGRESKTSLLEIYARNMENFLNGVQYIFLIWITEEQKFPSDNQIEHVKVCLRKFFPLVGFSGGSFVNTFWGVFASKARHRIRKLWARRCLRALRRHRQNKYKTFLLRV